MKDLKSIGMEKGLLYETIVTTKNEDDMPNAAPIGVICKDTLEIVLYLYEGTHTLQNIKSTPQFIVNITKDPLIFANSTLGDLSLDYFGKYDDNYYIKNTDAFFIATVSSAKEVEKEDNIGKSRVNVIKANVNEIIIKNEPVEPLNRAIFAIIESLVYLSRIEIVDEETKNIYSKRIKEMSRLVNRVGGLNHKKTMKNILKHVKNK